MNLMQQMGVQLRDLRLLDPKLATSYPSAILCRERALVVNMEYIKAGSLGGEGGPEVGRAAGSTVVPCLGPARPPAPAEHAARSVPAEHPPRSPAAHAAATDDSDH